MQLSAFLLISLTIARADDVWPADLTSFDVADGRTVFTAGGEEAWDAAIRERGWILKEGDNWRMWYTGYNPMGDGQMKLGLATSTDGIHWERSPENPIYSEHWVEDVQVVKHEGRYLMFAEGAGDRAQLLESPDGVQLDAYRSARRSPNQR